MREVKFRGKSIDEEKTGWFYGDYCSTPNPNILFENLDGEIDCEPIVPETVGQYTGLKDKNGKEIYEGDILETEKSIYDHTVLNLRVKYIGAGFALVHPEHHNNISELVMPYYVNRTATVIGNIYETPELPEEQA
jgi:uncharacterized phage protein (TIGR01671 family)